MLLIQDPILHHFHLISIISEFDHWSFEVSTQHTHSTLPHLFFKSRQFKHHHPHWHWMQYRWMRHDYAQYTFQLSFSSSCIRQMNWTGFPSKVMEMKDDRVYMEVNLLLPSNFLKLGNVLLNDWLKIATRYASWK